MRDLKELRESKGMSQHDVAMKLDVTDVAVSRWECGRSKPLHKNRERMANIYGVDEETIDEAVRHISNVRRTVKNNLTVSG